MAKQKYDNLYDYPKFYDLLFGSDWKAEFDFLQACFEKHAGRKVKRIFEPACGTGRLLIKLAQAGYEVGGNDLNAKAIDYCNARLKRNGFPASTQVGDMADFAVKKKFDAAFNTINSFRHLPSEELAESHLHCVASGLNKGGLYLLGLHLLPLSVPRTMEESWNARRGNLSINSHMWSKGIDKKGRNEKLGLIFDIDTPTDHQRIEDEMNYRTYSQKQFEELLAKVPELEVVETYDFCYEMDHTIEVSASTEDVVFILRRT